MSTKPSTSKDKAKNQGKAKKLKLNKETLKDLDPNDEKVKGGGQVGGTGPISGTCVTICKGHCPN